jgi:hypothetical protein
MAGGDEVAALRAFSGDHSEEIAHLTSSDAVSTGEVLALDNFEVVAFAEHDIFPAVGAQTGGDFDGVPLSPEDLGDEELKILPSNGVEGRSCGRERGSSARDNDLVFVFSGVVQGCSQGHMGTGRVGPCAPADSSGQAPRFLFS